MIDINNIELKPNERLDDLGEGYFIIQDNDKFLFGMDAVLLSDYASKRIKKKSRVAEIGTGNGIIPILVKKRQNFESFDAFEIQKDMASLAKRNIELNNFEDKINVIAKDVREIKDIPPNYYDILISNPPYFKLEENKSSKIQTISPNESKRIARSEETLNLDDLFSFAKKTLKQNGKLLIIHRPSRLGEIIKKAKDNLLEPKAMRFIYPKQNKEANLVLIEFAKLGREYLKVEEPLIIYEGDNYTDEVNKIYKGIK